MSAAGNACVVFDTRELVPETWRPFAGNGPVRSFNPGLLKDGDGWIKSGEFQSLLHTLDPELSADECLLAFDIADDDGDGLISFEEFMGWWNGE